MCCEVNSNKNAHTASRGYSNHSELAAHDGDTEYDDDRTNTQCVRGYFDQFRAPVRGNDPSSCRRSEQLSRSLSGPPQAGRGFQRVNTQVLRSLYPLISGEFIQLSSNHLFKFRDITKCTLSPYDLPTYKIVNVYHSAIKISNQYT